MLIEGSMIITLRINVIEVIVEEFKIGICKF